MHSGGRNIVAIFLHNKMIKGECHMEKRTIYIHKAKNDDSQSNTNTEYRTVSFIGGNKDIMQIIKELIKDKYKS